MEQKQTVFGNGILKTSAREFTVFVDEKGNTWICDKDAEVSGFDFKGAGCVAHSEVHLVK